MTPAATSPHRFPARLLLGAVAASALLLAACDNIPFLNNESAPTDTAPSSDEAAPDAGAPADDADAAASPAIAPTVIVGWVRNPPGGRDVTAGYVTLQAGAEDDQLVGARSAAAERIELHTMADDGEVMRMRQVDAIDLPAGERVALEQGGDHLMLFGVGTGGLGTEVTLTLEFASGAEATIRLPVLDGRPDADARRAIRQSLQAQREAGGGR